MKPALELLRDLRSGRDGAAVSSPAPAPDPEAYARLDEAFAGDCGTLEDLRACEWFYRLNPHLIDEIPELERACVRLGEQGASTTEYRTAVRHLAARMRDIRTLYRNRSAANPDRPPSSEDRVVVIAEPCLICNGVEYWPIPVTGFFRCRTCHDAPPKSSASTTSRRKDKVGAR